MRAAPPMRSAASKANAGIGAGPHNTGTIVRDGANGQLWPATDRVALTSLGSDGP
jgi:hypothetical protein